MTYITLDELQAFAPTDATDYNTTKLAPLANDATRVVFNSLPKSMVAVIKEQAPLDAPFATLPELGAFWNDLCKDWIAKQIWMDMLRLAGANVSPEGARTYTSQQSVETDNSRKSDALNMVSAKLNQVQRTALNDYVERRYIYDGVAYPPTRNMDGYWADWMGNYAYQCGVSGWGWYGNGAFYGFNPSFGTRKNQTFGVSFVG